MSAKLESITITYFPIGGRAQSIYYILEDAGVPYERSGVPESWAETKKDCSKFPFNQLPVADINGVRLAQADAILRYISRNLTGYTPVSFDDQTRVDMLACSIEDLHTAYTTCVYHAEAPKMLAKYINDIAPKFLGQYEYMLAHSTGPEGTFADQEKPSFPEFSLLHLVQGLLILSPSALAAFPLLTKWHARISARPNIVSYLESGRKPEMLNAAQIGQKELELSE